MNIVQRAVRAVRELGLAGRPNRSEMVVQASSPIEGETHFLRTQGGSLDEVESPMKRGFLRARLNAKSDSGHSRDASGEIGQVGRFEPSDAPDESGSGPSPFIRRTGTSFALIYISRSTGAGSVHDQLRDLRNSSRVRNESLGVASAIVLQDGMFCHWLEGCQDVVEAVYNQIKRDPRHEAVMCIFRGEVRASMLDNWCMGFRSLSMSHEDAFARACEIRRGVEKRAYLSPHAAWLGFAGLRGSERPRGSESTAFVDRIRRVDQSHTRSISVISLRSALSSQLLADANRSENVKIMVGRWGAERDADSDLQSAEALVSIGGEQVRMLCASFRSLRVGILREMLIRSHEIIVALPEDDMNKLEEQLALLTDALASNNGVRLVSVLAPTWNAVSTAHALHLLKINHFAGQTHEIDLFERGCWADFVNAVGG